MTESMTIYKITVEQDEKLDDAAIIARWNQLLAEHEQYVFQGVIEDDDDDDGMPY